MVDDGVFTPGRARRFVHPKGQTHSVEVADCRVYQGWTVPGKKRGQSSAWTHDDDDAALAIATAKVHELLKKGFVETEGAEGHVFDRDADVVAAFHSDVDYAGERREDFQPVPGKPNVYATPGPPGIHTWLVTRDDRKRAILVRCVSYGSKLGDAERVAMADAVLERLVALREEIFADEKSPLRKIPLQKPIGRFTHLAILSPAAEDLTISRDVSFANHVIGRSVFRAFPIFDCEATGTETVTLAEGRTSGHASLPSSRWDRDPHPVVDLAYLDDPEDPPKFLVFDPKTMEARLGKELARMKSAVVLARNYAGEVRRFTRGQAAPDVAELRRFFGY